MQRKAQVQMISVILIAAIAVGVISTTYFWGMPLIQKGESNSEVTQAKNLMLSLAKEIDDIAAGQVGDQRLIPLQVNGKMEVLGGDKNLIEYRIMTKIAAVATTEWVPLNDKTLPKREELHAVKNDNVIVSVMLSGGVSCNMKTNCPTKSLTLSGCSAAGTYSEGGTFTINNNPYIVDHVDCTGTLDGFGVIKGPDEEIAGVSGTNKPGVLVARAVLVGDMYETTFRLVYRELDDLETKKGYKIQLVEKGNTKATSGSRNLIMAKGSTTSSGVSKTGGELITNQISVSVS